MSSYPYPSTEVLRRELCMKLLNDDPSFQIKWLITDEYNSLVCQYRKADVGRCPWDKFKVEINNGVNWSSSEMK